ncbi:MAG: 3'-5' exonuclease [Candidatus Gastranaerophilales bacterium]|nr:3'-5' exonuclease [Candidatus Gastranaerophilales bacterium]
MQLNKDYPTDFTIIDLETTGLSPYKNSIIELSAIKVRNDEIVGTFTKLVKPSEPINSFVQNLTGITNEIVETASPITDVLPEYIDFIGTDVVLGHNVKFDIRFISQNLQKHFKRKFTNNSFDTMVLSRRFCTDVVSHKLSSLAEYFDIDSKGHHRGLKDCEMTFYVYKNIKQKYADKILV